MDYQKYDSVPWKLTLKHFESTLHYIEFTTVQPEIFKTVGVVYGMTNTHKKNVNFYGDITCFNNYMDPVF